MERPFAPSQGNWAAASWQIREEIMMSAGDTSWWLKQGGTVTWSELQAAFEKPELKDNNYRYYGGS